MISRRGPGWTVLGLLFGALAVLLLPVGRAKALSARAAVSSSAVAATDMGPGMRPHAGCEPGRVVIATTVAHGLWCRSHVSAVRPDVSRSPSWHRSTSRRQQRDSHPLPLAGQVVGSIPAAESLTGERGEGYARIGVPPHATGRLAIAPRAPPALN